MPTLRLPLWDPGNYGREDDEAGPSSGQHWSTGKSRTLKFSRSITCLTVHHRRPLCGEKPAHPASTGQHLQLPSRPSGDLRLSRASIRPATSSRLSTSSAIFMRRSLPKLVHTAPGCPGILLSFQTTVQGHPERPCFPRVAHLDTLSVISAISRMGSTGSWMRFSSPACPAS